MKNVPFYPANILLPKNIGKEWSVIACDQYTSEPEYWETLKELTGGKNSTLELILPEVYLGDGKEERIRKINENMQKYIDDGIFEEYEDAMIFVERTLPSGEVRKGIMGALDLEEYDYTNTRSAAIRATEQTVLSRIPPRVEIRKGAAIELPHVLMLIDDEKKNVIEPLSKLDMPVLYDYDLLMGGGHIKGKLITKDVQKKVLSELSKLYESCADGLLFASGDGNHSLASAKACYEETHLPLQRYALVEVVNLHDDALCFEPIYRVLFGTDIDTVKSELDKFFSEKTKGEMQKLRLVAGGKEEKYEIKNPRSMLTVGSVEKFIQYFLAEHKEACVDYIHGDDTVRRLCLKEGTVGFLYRGMGKDELFPTVINDGTLPRKTFSMGEAASKRYYTECRKIK